jgi:hypothetical protein
MLNMRKICFAFLALALAGCSSSVHYDFDMTCKSQATVEVPVPFKVTDINADTKQLSCSGVDGAFEIQCEASTLQKTFDANGSFYYCTTKDGKSVRVKVITIPPPKGQEKEVEEKWLNSIMESSSSAR